MTIGELIESLEIFAKYSDGGKTSTEIDIDYDQRLGVGPNDTSKITSADRARLFALGWREDKGLGYWHDLTDCR